MRNLVSGVFAYVGLLSGSVMCYLWPQGAAPVVPSPVVERAAQNAIDSGAQSNFQGLLRALSGDRNASGDLVLGIIGQESVPSIYYDLLCSQNGFGGAWLARNLFWSGNVFNKIRATFWVKGMNQKDIINVFWPRFIGAELRQDVQNGNWISVNSKDDQERLIALEVNKLGFIKEESSLLGQHARSALCGSIESARLIWKYYYSDLLLNPPILFKLGTDWIAMFSIELQGFPGASCYNKYMYWLIVAAENGDPESQWQLSRCFYRGEPGSNARSLYWAKKAQEGGFRPPAG